MGHAKAKLTLAGRRLLVERIEHDGWSAAVAAEAVGVARATAYKWVRRYRGEGIAGLVDRSCRPLRSPRALTPDQVRQIVRLRPEARAPSPRGPGGPSPIDDLRRAAAAG